MIFQILALIAATALSVFEPAGKAGAETGPKARTETDAKPRLISPSGV